MGQVIRLKYKNIKSLIISLKWQYLILVHRLTKVLIADIEVEKQIFLQTKTDKISITLDMINLTHQEHKMYQS